MNRIFKKNKRLVGLFIFGLVLLFGVGSATPVFAGNASLYFSPTFDSYIIGNKLSVSVFVSSSDQSMNAASGVISFPPDKLEVISLSKSGSIFTFWVQKPSFSNNAGTVNFEGIILNPGFTGINGKIITINFKVKAAGTALLNFSSGSILANDGKGTNILASLGKTQFNLGSAVSAVPEATTSSKIAGTSSAPQIFSPARSNPNKWYMGNNPKFTNVALKTPTISKMGTQTTTLVVIVLLVAFIILLLAFIWYSWYKFSLIRKRLKKEISETEKTLQQAFKTLKKETKKQVAKLDNKPGLSKREKAICNELKKALKISEKFIKKIK